MSDLDSLNRNFAIPDHVTFIAGPGGLTVARIRNRRASGDIALQGAHVLTFQPEGEAPVIWLSSQAKFAPGKSVRGGVPVCWPWFGNHASEADFPAHGFARTTGWQVIASAALPDGATRITFELEQNDATRAQWPHTCQLHHIVTVGRELTLELVTRNTGTTPFEITEALHTYFAIGDIGATRITGLAGCEYLDKTDGYQRKTEPGTIDISAEVDRVYLNTTADCIIEDRQLNRRIRIAKTGSQSTVVWNPWIEKTRQMGDLGEDGYRGMVCVESANAAENAVTVAPGATHTLRAIYSTERL
ncbi:MAG: D-hexose-6-phosphate mutarotase [Nitrosomonadales bacterium]|nr:MAG: D-hexose-6-phosphate mutarotase [Nitrosomonadales bacterium]